MYTCYDCNGFEGRELCIKLKKLTDEDAGACYAFRDKISGLTRHGKHINTFKRAEVAENSMRGVRT